MKAAGAGQRPYGVDEGQVRVGLVAALPDAAAVVVVNERRQSL